jgi:hypothetical protein
VLTVYRRHPPVVAIGDIENDEANTMGLQSVLRLKLQLALVMVLLLESGNIENDRNK